VWERGEGRGERGEVAETILYFIIMRDYPLLEFRKNYILIPL